MDVFGFTIDDIAFPISPTELIGFTITGFAFPVFVESGAVCGTVTITPRVGGRVQVESC